jgi:hypothetical protein
MQPYETKRSILEHESDRFVKGMPDNLWYLIHKIYMPLFRVSNNIFLRQLSTILYNEVYDTNYNNDICIKKCNYRININERIILENELVLLCISIYYKAIYVQQFRI